MGGVHGVGGRLSARISFKSGGGLVGTAGRMGVSPSISREKKEG